MASTIRAKREMELISNVNNIEIKKANFTCFVSYFEQYAAKGKTTGVKSVARYLKTFSKGRIVPFGRIDPTWLLDLQDFFKNEGLSNNSLVRYMSDITGALEKAVKDGYIKSNPYHAINPSQLIKKQQTIPVSHTIEEIQHLAHTLCKIEPQFKQAFLFSCFSGLRWSDVNPLRWDEVIIKTINGQSVYCLQFEQEKTEELTYLPLSQGAIDILKIRQEECRTEPPSPYVFPKAKETNPKHKIIYRKLRRHLKKWAIAANLKGGVLKFHSSRHSFATNVLESCEDGDLYTVSKLLGHKDIKSTQIYVVF